MYDANDFRNAADYVETYNVFEDRDREIAVLLRQAADMRERFDDVNKAIGDELKKQEHCRKCEWRGKSIRSGPACPCDEDVHGVVFDIGVTDRIVKALRGDLEREKKYEYTAMFFRKRTGKCIAESASHYMSLEEAKRNNHCPLVGEEIRFARRWVGEWEEVEDGQN